jgi:GDP-4-dehydro-6-deoxy-D-mannose reductase
MVINMGGLASVAESWRAPADTFSVNVTGVVNLLQAVAEHAPKAHVTCVSSAEVYGVGAGKPVASCEDDPLEPLNPYGASKAAMEIVCGQYARSRNLRIAIIRAFNHFGPGQAPQFAVSDFARQVAVAELAGDSTVTLSVGNVAVARDFVDVRDASRAYVAVAQQRLAGTFNLCSGRAVKLETLIEELEKASPLLLEVKSSQTRARPVDVPFVVGSADRLQAATDWTPRISLRQSLLDLLQWWRSELTEKGVAGMTKPGIPT